MALTSRSFFHFMFDFEVSIFAVSVLLTGFGL